MINYNQGDMLLVDFSFSEGAGSKKRPALIISSDNYHKKRQEVIIMAITSNIDRVLFGDTRINQWKEAGLLFPSVVTAIIRTIKTRIAIRKLGVLSKQDFHSVRESLKKAIEA